VEGGLAAREYGLLAKNSNSGLYNMVVATAELTANEGCQGGEAGRKLRGEQSENEADSVACRFQRIDSLSLPPGKELTDFESAIPVWRALRIK